MSEFKQTVSGTVGSGMKSLFGGGGRTYYELQHKVSSVYHKAGEAQKIIVDEIKIGRNPKCQVRFDESFETVSREHAAIVRDGDNWKLIQLSKTNPTYLNGHPVANEWYLQSGDEIQLSTNGPKLGFVVPQGSGSLIKSIGLTQRVPMFINQALRPYKTAVTALVCALVLLICGGVWFGISQHQTIRAQGNTIAEQQRTADSVHRINEQTIAELAAQNEEQKKATKRIQQKFEEQRRKQEELARRLDSIRRAAASRPPVVHDGPQVAAVEPAVVSQESVNQAIESCIPNVFFIHTTKMKLTAPDGRSEEIDDFNWTGTGFLLSDGRFVTARHVVEPWMYPDFNDTTDVLLNLIASNGGRIDVWLEAISSTGKRFTFKNTQFKYKRNADTRETLDDGTVIIHAWDNPSDVAWVNVDDRSGLKADAALSNQLPRNTELKILGFPHGLGANSPTDITPISSTATTATPGLQNDVILTTNSNIEHGNSGGPALVINAQGQIVVVGVISAITGRSLGFIVPISEIY
mgnify:CR=1 FL=1